MTDRELDDLAAIVKDEAATPVHLRVAAAALLAEVRRTREAKVSATTSRVVTRPAGKRLGFRA